MKIIDRLQFHEDEEEFINEFGNEDEDISTILERVGREQTVLSVASGTSYLVSN